MFKYKIQSINLKNFRNFDDLTLNFTNTSISNPNGVFFIGENGVGKTSILEAISMLYPGRGIRGAKYANITKNHSLKADQTWNVNSYIDNGFMKNQMNVNFDGEKKSVHINGKRASKLSKILEHNCIIWVAQDDYHNFLISNSFRRNFFDRLICALEPSHIDHLHEYNHFLIQKQKLLKNYDSLYKNFSEKATLFEQLNKKLSELSSLICFTRKNICEKFNQIAPLTNFSLIPQIEIEENFDFQQNSVFSFFQEKIEDEIQAKRCLIGPHLAKISIKEIKGQNSISLLSSGEQRILLNNLILSQIQIYISSFNLHPIVLFDDILTFFDQKNQELLVKMILDLDVQFFIATNFLTDEIKKLDCQFFYLDK